MANVNTKYIRRVILEAENGKSMDELDFTLDFFVHANRLQTMKKSDLVRVSTEEGVFFYAVIDSQILGRGKVKCRVSVTDIEPRLEGMERPVVFVRDVGITIGGLYRCARDKVLKCFEEGFKINFEKVTDIPRQKAQNVMFGILKSDIASYGDITPSMVYGFSTADALDGISIGQLSVGDKVTILVDGDNPNHVLKNDGFGKYVPFDTSVLGSNGDYTITVDDKAYRIYGEMMLVSGELFFKLKIV